MKDNNTIGEQLEDATIVQATAVDSVDIGNDIVDASSPYGKFKDADSLYKAYNELQSEFTRKCQRLSELESSKVDNVDNIASTPTDTTANWQNDVDEFIKSHRLAMQYSKDITSELMRDSSLSKDRIGLEAAYSRVIESKFQSRDEMIQDEAFLQDYVYSNENIKKKIVNDYLNSINRAPTVLGNSSGNLSFTTNSKPTSLKEARTIVEEMLLK